MSVEKLEDCVRQRYGKYSQQIIEWYREHEPKMDDKLGCLEVLAQNPADFLISSTDRARFGQHKVDIGHDLVRELNAYARRVIGCINPDGIAYQVKVALEAHGFTAAEGTSNMFPERPNVGRRVYTGQTEQPGANPGYDPLTLPPR